MKVLIVHPGVPVYGGAEHLIVELCNYMTRQGIWHELLTTSLPEGMAADLPNTGVVQVRSRTGSRAEEVLALWLGVRRHGPHFDVINPHNFPASVAAGAVSKPVVWMCNEPPELFTSFARKPLEAYNRYLAQYRFANTVVADKFNAQRFNDIYHRSPETIWYGIDHEFFRNGSPRPPEDVFRILQVGVISGYKNQLATLEAAASLINQIPEMEVVFVGHVAEPAYARKVEHAVQELGLGGRVRFAGHVARTHLRSLYAVSHVVVHPCRDQGGWLTPFEAISAGVPVVVLPELPCAGLIRLHNLGTVTRDIAASVRRIYMNGEESRRQVMRARDWVVSTLSWDRFCEKMVTLFEEACQ